MLLLFPIELKIKYILTMKEISYALGLSIANNFRATGIKKVDVAEFTKGLEDVLNEVKPRISYEDAQQLLNDYFTKLQGEQLDLNLKAGEEFLAINAKKAGVTTLASGLQYEVLKEGTGKKPSATDQVKCHYHGTLIDGTVFDSSVDRGEAATFGVNQVIAGWVEALQLMSEGTKWRLFIPSNLAYGAQGAGQVIQPNSALVFDVELLEIV